MAEAAAIDLPGREPQESDGLGDHPAGAAQCFICATSAGDLAEIFGKWMCRDRVPCYQRWLGKR